MDLSPLETDVIRLYRCLSDQERLAIRRAVHLGDSALLSRLFRQEGDEADDLGVIAAAKGDDQGTLFAR